MTEATLFSVMSAILAILLAIIGFFMIRHFKKTDSLQTDVNSLAVTMAAVKIKVDTSATQISALEYSIRKQIDRLHDESDSSISVALDEMQNIKSLGLEVAKLSIKLGVITEIQTLVRQHSEKIGNVFIVLNKHNLLIKNLNKKIV